MKNCILRYSLWMLAALIFAACTHEQEPCEIGAPIPNGMGAIDFQLSIVNAPEEQQGVVRSTDKGEPLPTFHSLRSLLRATEEAGDLDQEAYEPNRLNENKIERLDLFLCSTAAAPAFFRHFPNSKVERLPSSSVSNIHKVRILLPYEELATYEGHSFEVVVVANAKENSLAEVSSLDQLQQKVQEDNLQLMSGDEPQAQPYFLMDGKGTTGTVHFSDNLYSMPTPVDLYRAAAKIRLRVQDADIHDYQNGKTTKYVRDENLQVKLVSYLNKTSLLAGHPYTPQSGDWQTSPYREVIPKKLPARDGKTDFLATFPFYSYESRWAAPGDDHEPYLLVKAKLRPESEPAGSGKNYYYRLPLNYSKSVDGVGADKLHRVARNHLYDILTRIEVLGSLSENEPMELASYVAIQPWNAPDLIDGTLTDAHYLLVKEKRPKMLNVDTYSIAYVSDMPVEVQLGDVYYEYYDVKGEYKKEVVSSVKVDVEGPHTKGKLIVRQSVPVNYLPLYINFKVKQKGGNLEEDVHVVQYPHRYLTYKKSSGPRGGKSFDSEGRPIYADFRYHTTFGSEDRHNDIFTRITTLVPEDGEKIGNPLDPNADGNTAKDEQSGELISPQFIMATHYGISASVRQYSDTFDLAWQLVELISAGFGPESSRFPKEYPYFSHYSGWNDSEHDQWIHRNYKNAGSRAKRYFEGEYGANGTYTEHYCGKDSLKTQREVRKEFKYNGHWRIPTAAELRVIAKIQADPNSKVKELLQGEAYWCAETGKAVEVKKAPYNKVDKEKINVRLVFDTWKWDDEDELRDPVRAR